MIDNNIAFVLGCGRSGTHWLGHILEAFSDVRITIEKNPQFNIVTSLANNLNLIDKEIPKLINIYKQELSLTKEKYYIDKSHPNLFLAYVLLKHFPGAKFLGIQRGPLGTIASMLNHSGIKAWHNRWRNYPIPNYFLGINEYTTKFYDELSLVQKCALRWISHKNFMDFIDKNMGDSSIVFSYEDMQENFDDNIKKIELFLGITAPKNLPRPKKSSMDKWKKVLSDKDIEDIAEIVGEEASILVS